MPIVAPVIPLVFPTQQISNNDVAPSATLGGCLSVSQLSIVGILHGDGFGVVHASPGAVVTPCGLLWGSSGFVPPLPFPPHTPSTVGGSGIASDDGGPVRLKLISIEH
ncbi:hypothetical protein SUGI_0694290 [Cryptomeria japonica]|nr:hypothetical protein SUGI_0694290 [Cryptomeria japonica]